jgi:hypothetical protein
MTPELAAFVGLARRSKPWQRRACAQMLRDLHGVIERVIRDSEHEQRRIAGREQRGGKRR